MAKELKFKIKKSTIKQTKADHIFDVINVIILSLLAFSMILPFINLLAVSLSSQVEISSGRVSFWPRGFTDTAYRFVLQESLFWSGMKVSLFVTIVGTVLAMIVTTMAAYPLSRKTFRERKFFMILFIITMVFSGGLVPSYLLVLFLGLRDNIWALILPGLVSTYNMLLIKNYFETLPEEILESAKIDGANEFQIFINIVLPLSLPTMATVALFYAVGFWNAYFGGVLYISTPSKQPLQTYLRGLLALSYIPIHDLPPEIAERLSTDSIRAATVFSATVPILILYPFLQKYFVKGLVVGSDK